MCGRFSRPKKIGKRSSASLFFTPESHFIACKGSIMANFDQNVAK